MATAPASGIKPNATMIRLWAVACVALRPKWSRSRFVRNTRRPVRGRISAAQVTSDAIARKNRTSMKEYSATCHFDSALESANMTVAPSINKMPSGIRSARKLARWSRLSVVKAGPSGFRSLPSMGEGTRAGANAYGNPVPAHDARDRQIQSKRADLRQLGYEFRVFLLGPGARRA